MSSIDVLNIILAVSSIVISFSLALVGINYSQKGNESLAKIEEKLESFRGMMHREVEGSRKAYREDIMALNDRVFNTLLTIVQRGKESSGNNELTEKEKEIEKALLELRNLPEKSAFFSRKKIGG